MKSKHVKCGCLCHRLFHFIGLYVNYVRVNALQAANYNYTQFNGSVLIMISIIFQTSTDKKYIITI